MNQKENIVKVRTKKGTIVSAKAPKTLVVKVDTYKTHPKYQKRFKVSKKFYAHYEEGKYEEGQVVTIEETRPMSKLKRWKVINTK